MNLGDKGKEQDLPFLPAKRGGGWTWIEWFDGKAKVTKGKEKKREEEQALFCGVGLGTRG